MVNNNNLDLDQQYHKHQWDLVVNNLDHINNLDFEK